MKNCLRKIPKFAQKGYFQSNNRKSEHHQRILHIRISLDTKFPLKMTILIFWIKHIQKGYFGLKTKKVNITIEFWIPYIRFSLGNGF